MKSNLIRFAAGVAAAGVYNDGTGSAGSDR